MTKKTTWYLRRATPREIGNWDKLIARNYDKGNFLQSHVFAKLKSKYGWKPLYFMYENGQASVAALALKRHIPVLGDLWYFPKGPNVEVSQFNAIFQATMDYAMKYHGNVFLIQIEPEWPKELPIENITTHKYVFQSNGIQAHTSTVILPLANSIDELFASLSKRARYSIRLGQRENVKVKQVAATEKNFQLMYGLMKTVAGGRGVAGIRSYEYYQRFWKMYVSSNQGRLYFAFEDGEPVIGAFVIIVGQKAYYKDGGSNPSRKSKGASYLTQWQILQDMKALGMASYDMLGTPPDGKRHDTTHPLHGVGLFKTAFQQKITDYHGVFDIALSPSRYTLWKKYLYPFLGRIYRLKNRYFY